MKTLFIAHNTVTAALRNLPEDYNKTIATGLVYSVLECITPEEEGEPQEYTPPDPRLLQIYHCRHIDIPEEFDRTLRDLFEQIAQGTWGLSAGEEVS